MRSIMLMAGAAALAVAAPALAKPDRGGGGGGQGGGGKPAKVERGGGGKGGGQGARAERRGGNGGQARAQRERGPERREARAQRERGPDRREARVQRERGPERRQAQVQRERSPDRREVRVREERRADRGRAERPIREARVEQRQDRIDRRADRRDIRTDSDRNIRVSGAEWSPLQRFRTAEYRGSRGQFDGCPPGLAAKNNGCLPPGQYKKLIGNRVAPALISSGLLPYAYRNWYPDSDDYYYRTGDDGLMYRIARSSGLIDGYSPLFDDDWGTDYYPDYYYAGERYPLDYVSFYNVPAAYDEYYRDDDDWYYRYGDGGIYQVNRSSGLVESIVALLAGDLAVGQPLPAGYDVYNVPYAYRDRYYDTADNWYRYNDGHIYRVDPTTQLITAVIQALV